MTSWRDTASDQAQADLDGLLNAVLPFAQQQLDARGEFFPFGATVDRAGQIAMTAADAGDNGSPDSQAILKALFDGVRARRGDQRAAAFVADVVLAEGGSAIRVELEHAEGASMSVALPYTRGRIRKSVSYGQLRAGEGRARVWTEA